MQVQTVFIAVWTAAVQYCYISIQNATVQTVCTAVGTAAVQIVILPSDCNLINAGVPLLHDY